jgi:hypothetical protein
VRGLWQQHLAPRCIRRHVLEADLQLVEQPLHSRLPPAVLSSWGGLRVVYRISHLADRSPSETFRRNLLTG